MQKKFFKKTTALFVCGALISLFASCGGDSVDTDTISSKSNNIGIEQSVSESKTHKHTYEKNITKPTCTKKGFTTYTCECGDTYVDDYVNQYAHSYKEQVTKQPTCISAGKKTFTCSICGENYTETFDLNEYSASDVYAMSQASIGEIITYDKNGNEYSLETGFVYSSDGKIITNYHVIEDAYSAKITIEGKSYNVESVLAYDATIDLVVLKINASNLPMLDICYTEHPVGKTVYAFGSSKGLTATFSQGIITYAQREIAGVCYVQHDAAISSGNSGGPLINQFGEIIGINTMTLKDSQNLNFAISATEIKNLIYGTPLTVAEFYEKECDVFTKLANYIIAKGSYDTDDNEYTLTLGYSYSNDYSSKYTRRATYDLTNNEIELTLFIDADYLIMITIDEVDGIYSWGYIDKNNYCMLGTLYANTYDSNTLLGYNYNNISSSSLRSSVRKLASSMVSLLCVYMDVDYKEIGVTAEDLGFLYY